MTDRRAASLVGIAQKAGLVASGEAALSAIREGRAQLVLLARDASENSKKKIRDKAAWYEVPLHTRWRMAELGAMTGKAERACLVILDEGLAKEIERHLNWEDENGKVGGSIGKNESV